MHTLCLVLQSARRFSLLYNPFDANVLVMKFGLRHSRAKSLLSKSKTQPLNVMLYKCVFTTSDVYDKSVIYIICQNLCTSTIIFLNRKETA